MVNVNDDHGKTAEDQAHPGIPHGAEDLVEDRGGSHNPRAGGEEGERRHHRGRVALEQPPPARVGEDVARAPKYTTAPMLGHDAKKSAAGKER